MILTTSGCAHAQQNKNVSYGDCAYVDIGEVDESTLTREEIIKRMEENLFAGLDNTEECMKAAVATSSKKIGDAAGGVTGFGGNQASDSSGSIEASSSGQPGNYVGSGGEADQDQSNSNSENNSGAASSGSSPNSVTTGNSAVCDTVSRGLAEVKTDEEKAHWSGLSQKYNCN
ncbi:hypothetical protein [Alteromonas sp. S167]|uniref:hypothetical protein n=1 Tax=Alteromonas sp. S167 TaxID=3117402 RepID=UPI002FDF5E0B